MRVYSRVVEQPVRETVQLEEERVDVERRPASRPAGGDAFREQSFEVRERAEEPVVEKRALGGRGQGRQEAQQDEHALSDTVRKRGWNASARPTRPYRPGAAPQHRPVYRSGPA